MKSNPSGFCQKKWTLVLIILAAGMALALLWSMWASLVKHEGYPQSYVLGPPAIRFNDFVDQTLVAVLPNPYVDPTSFYPPPAFIFLRIFTAADSTCLIFVYFFSMVALAALLVQVLQPVVPGNGKRVSLAFLFLALSYPVLFCLDRGNIEIILAPLIGWGVYFYTRERDVAGTLCIFPAICLKFYPVLLLVFLLRRGKVGLAFLCVAGVVAVTAGSCFLFEVPAGTIWAGYHQDLDFYRDYTLLGGTTLEGAASPWNAYKICLVTLQWLNLLPTINFGFDGPFIRASYLAYSLFFGLFALICGLYAWLCEASLTRGIVVLFLFLSIAAPSGADYRLMYATLALVFLVVVAQQRRGDWAALILIALAVIPKKQVLLTYLGGTETGYPDVPIQAVLNPLFILCAIGILIFQSQSQFDPKRCKQLLHDLYPSRWRWS